MNISLQLPLETSICKEIRGFTEKENELMLVLGSRGVFLYREELKKVQKEQSNDNIIKEVMNGYLSNEKREIQKKYEEMVKECNENNIFIVRLQEQLKQEQEKNEIIRNDAIVECEIAKKNDEKTKEQEYIIERIKYETQIYKLQEQIKNREENQEIIIKNAIIDNELLKTNENVEKYKKNEEEKVQLKQQLLEYNNSINNLQERLLIEKQKQEQIINNANMKHKIMEEETKQILNKKIMEIENEKQLLEEKQSNLIHNHKLEMEITINLLQEQYNKKIVEDKDNEHKLLKEKNEETIQELKNIIFESNKINNTSLSYRLGQTGEDILEELLIDTFGNYEGFELNNTSKQSCSGDFQVNFKNFTILMDSKNYKLSNVKKTEIDKIKRDMDKNKHIKIAWLVALDKPISTKDDLSFSKEICDDVCFCFINLGMVSNIRDTLKMVWNVCDDFIKYTNANKLEETNIDILFEKYKIKDETTRISLEKMLNTLKKQKPAEMVIKETREELTEIIMRLLNDNYNNIINSLTQQLQEWWNSKCQIKEGNKMQIAKIYSQFLKDTKIKKENFDIEMMKKIIPTILNESYLEYGTGKDRKAINIIGFGYK